MPKLQRTREEIEQAKALILEKAARLIADIGYLNFTMRKLANELGITATTIYNYYQSKDDLFINLLIMGFTDLLERLKKAHDRETTPHRQLRRMIDEYTHFGLTNPNFYNVMYTWDVPKYNHYAGSSMEPVATRQRDIALQIPGLFESTIRDYARELAITLTDEEIRFLLIHYWSQIHGFIAGCNNTVLSYIHHDPVSLKEKHLDGIASKFEKDVSAHSQGEKQ